MRTRGRSGILGDGGVHHAPERARARACPIDCHRVHHAVRHRGRLAYTCDAWQIMMSKMLARCTHFVDALPTSRL